MVAVLTSGFSSFMQLLAVLFIFCFILIITYFTTKWIAGYEKGRSYNKNLKVIETLKITTNKYIQIVEAGDEFLVIAIGKDEIALLTKLSKEQIKEIPAEQLQMNLPTENFKEIFERFKEHLPKK